MDIGCVARLAMVSVVFLTSFPPAFASVIDWQGGGGWWGDSNWTVDGIPDQALSAPDPVTYTDDAFTVPVGDGNLLRRNGQIIVSGSSGRFDLISGTFQLTATGAYSAFNVAGGAQAVLSGTAIMELAPGPTGGRTLGGDLGAMTVRDQARLLVRNQEIDIKNGFELIVQDAAYVEAPFIQMANAATSILTLAGGHLRLSDANPLRTTGSWATLGGNITATPGQLLIEHTNLTGATLASKLGGGFFRLDGVRMTPVADGSDLAALNAELASNWVVNGKHVRVEDVAGVQVLQVVPEPGSAGLLLLGAASLGWMRQRKSSGSKRVLA